MREMSRMGRHRKKDAERGRDRGYQGRHQASDEGTRVVTAEAYARVVEDAERRETERLNQEGDK